VFARQSSAGTERCRRCAIAFIMFDYGNFAL
jgi:hypothetical protein